MPLRFVVLRHDRDGTHWDLMIEREAGGALATWALDVPPDEARGAVAARRLADHRRVYLEYEGEISGGRGTATRRDEGECRVQTDAGGNLEIEFDGAHLTGWASLRTTASGDSSGSDWFFERGKFR